MFHPQKKKQKKKNARVHRVSLLYLASPGHELSFNPRLNNGTEQSNQSQTILYSLLPIVKHTVHPICSAEELTSGYLTFLRCNVLLQREHI